MYFRRFKKQVTILALVLSIIGVLFWNVSRVPQVFGSHDVIIASSLNLFTWLSLNERSCSHNDENILFFRYLEVKLVCQTTQKPCYIWYWDVANWTLIYTHEKIPTNTSSHLKLCPIPIHGERTARIIDRDGKVDYPGCTKEKYPCAAMHLFAASFDKKLQQRINRSPCCRKLLVDITQHMGRVFDKHNITYLLLFGAVISLVRDQGILIPYDTDIDVGVDFNDLEKLENAIPDLQKPGFIFKWKMEYTKGLKRYMIGCTNSHCLTGPGIALYSIKGETIAAPVTGWRPLPIKLTIPPIRRNFEGLEMGFPKEPEQFLDFYYGQDKWRGPMRCIKHYYEQCVE